MLCQLIWARTIGQVPTGNRRGSRTPWTPSMLALISVVEQRANRLWFSFDSLSEITINRARDRARPWRGTSIWWRRWWERGSLWKPSATAALCVFDYKIKLRCGGKVRAMPSAAAAPTKATTHCSLLPHIWSNTHTLQTHGCGESRGKNCSSSEQLFSAYHLVKRIRFTLPCGSVHTFTHTHTLPNVAYGSYPALSVSVYKSTNLLPTAKLGEDRQLYPLSAHNFCMS